MSVLRGALQGSVFLRRDGCLERRAGLLPAGPEFCLAGAAEAALRQLGRAETGEAQQPRLLVRRWRAARLLKRLRQDDRGDVVARPRGPAAGKLPVAGEGKLLPRATGADDGGGVSLPASASSFSSYRSAAVDDVGQGQLDNAVLSNRLSVKVSLGMVVSSWLVVELRAAARPRPPGSGRAGRPRIDRRA
jgi:hypothetical protein